MTPKVADIVARSDSGEQPDAIAVAVGLRPGRVYAVLREHRPDRQRKPRTRTSAVPDKVRGLASTGMLPARIAMLLGVKRQYVYKILSEGTQQ
jgi:hypothetical protein